MLFGNRQPLCPLADLRAGRGLGDGLPQSDAPGVDTLEGRGVDEGALPALVCPAWSNFQSTSSASTSAGTSVTGAFRPFGRVSPWCSSVFDALCSRPGCTRGAGRPSWSSNAGIWW